MRKRSAHRKPAAFVEEPTRDGCSTTAETLPRLAIDPVPDPLIDILRAASRLVLTHPVAAQAAFSAVVAEGRRFAQTAAGRRWKEVLAASPLIQRGSALWEGSVLSLLEDDPATILPSAILDAVVLATQRNDLLSVLQRLALDSADD
jgi:hypothetical protein